uniref:transketolase n=1 Tax=Glossina pallidipes TaxID=7398 RepID=A0A1B0A439_GLOPL
MAYLSLKEETIQELQNIAHRLRIHAITSTQAAKSGHPTSCSSIAEIMSVLFFYTMRLNLQNPRHPASDRLILSKGHAAPILYAAWAEVGLFPVENLLNLRKYDSDLEGHPTPRSNFIDVATGSLGQGVAIAAGMAYVGKYFDKSNYRIYVVVGDGESAEGSVWESLHFAAHHKLDNLCIIFDVNRLGQSGPTSLGHQTDIYRQRLEGFGCNVYVINGHEVEDLIEAFHEAAYTKKKPTAVIAKTFKGKHFPNIEDMECWHGRPLGNKAESVINHLQDLIVDAEGHELSIKNLPSIVPVPDVDITNVKLSTPPAYEIGDPIATRLAYGSALVKLVEYNNCVIALDGDTSNSTFSDKLKKAFPANFIECFIAEQNLVGAAIGAACRDRTIVFASTFAAFFTRAFDQLRMGAISGTNANFVGTHCGVSIGEDGPSQMGLEDIALFRALPGSTVFYPSDAVSCERAVELAANTKGICFIRTSRPNTTVIYDNNETFAVGKAHVLRQSPKDQILLIGACVTLMECLRAAIGLERIGMHARVLDPFTIKPLDRESILENGYACYGLILVVEDHYQHGGLGEAVLSALADRRGFIVKHLFVPSVPRSGSPNTLLDRFGISARHIYKAAKELIEIDSTVF